MPAGRPVAFVSTAYFEGLGLPVTSQMVVKMR